MPLSYTGNLRAFARPRRAADDPVDGSSRDGSVFSDQLPDSSTGNVAARLAWSFSYSDHAFGIACETDWSGAADPSPVALLEPETGAPLSSPGTFTGASPNVVVTDPLPPVFPNASPVGTGGSVALLADTLRNTFGIDGTGVKIGVLSDSFNSKGGAAADMASGALPASGVQVLQEGPSGTDEGRAMLELVHQIAPGASLAFYSTDVSETSFANGVTALANAGCNIIVDDATYLDEPFFQDDAIAEAINAAAARGVAYFTSAGNEASHAYQATFQPTATTLPNGSFVANAQNFGGSALQSITMASGAIGILQWDQAWGHATSILDVRAFQNGVFVGSVTNNDGPNPLILFQNTSPFTQTFQIAITVDAGPNPGLIKYILFGDGLPVSINNFATNSGTVFGHHDATGAIAVGAANSAAPTQPESFSSTGPAQILFDDNGNRLATPVTTTVGVTGVDGIATSLPGNTGLNPFFGTSAAAPTVAAVAALLEQAAPAVSNTGIEAAIENTATDIGTAGVDNATGHGLVNALAAANSIATPHVYVANNGGDVIYPGTGNNTVTGGAGNDTIYITKASSNAIDGGGGTNTLDYSAAVAGVTVNFATGMASNGFGGVDTLSNIENVVGSPHNDTLIVGTRSETLNGGAGTDTVVYDGSRTQYLITALGNGVFQVADQWPSAPDGTDAVSNVEVFQFANGSYSLSAPVVTILNVMGRAQSLAASSLFSASDGLTDVMAEYQFTDGTADPASGHFVLNGVAQAANQVIDLTASQLPGLSFQRGAVSDALGVRVSDGIQWSNWSTFNLLAPVDHAPVVSAATATATHGQSFAASSLFTASDPDADTITTYEFADGTADPASGHFVLNGVAQLGNAVFDVSAAQLAQTSFQSGSISDLLGLRAFDGTLWSDWAFFNVNPPINHAPVVTASDVTASNGQSLAAASLFTASDPDGDTITAYEFADGTTDPASGHFVVNGVAQLGSPVIDVSAAQLGQTSFQSGSVSDTLAVRVFDGALWSNWSLFHVNPAVNHAPVVAAADVSASNGQSLAAASLFTASDPDGDTITAYEFADGTTDPASGHFVVNGVAQLGNPLIDVSAAQLAQTSFQSGSVSDILAVRVFDGALWSNWSLFHVNPAVNHAPVVTAPDVSASNGQSLAAASLFTASDPDGDTITTYEFADGTADPASGHFVVNGVAQLGNPVIDVSAAQLAQTSFQSGSVSDTLAVRVFDGALWSSWSLFHVNPPVNHAPVVTGGDASLALNASVNASSLFTVSDADNDPITEYQFADGNANATSGHFALNGVAQPANQVIDVLASQLTQGIASFVAGSTPSSDTLGVRASDGTAWSDWHIFTANSHA